MGRGYFTNREVKYIMYAMQAVVGAELPFDTGDFVTVFEGDLLEGLTYTDREGEHTVTGRVRVLKCRTRAITNTPDECPPEPYVEDYITPTSMILDVSQEDDADFLEIDFENITGVEKINGKDTDEELIDAIIESLPGVKVTEREDNVYDIITSTGKISDTEIFDTILLLGNITKFTVTDGKTTAEYGDGIDTSLEMFKQVVDAMIPKSNFDSAVSLTLTVTKE